MLLRLRLSLSSFRENLSSAGSSRIVLVTRKCEGKRKKQHERRNLAAAAATTTTTTSSVLKLAGDERRRRSRRRRSKVGVGFGTGVGDVLRKGSDCKKRSRTLCFSGGVPWTADQALGLVVGVSQKCVKSVKPPKPQKRERKRLYLLCFSYCIRLNDLLTYFDCR